MPAWGCGREKDFFLCSPLAWIVLSRIFIFLAYFGFLGKFSRCLLLIKARFYFSKLAAFEDGGMGDFLLLLLSFCPSTLGRWLSIKM